MTTHYLDLEDLLVLVDDLGVGPVRDLGLLDSAAHRPRTSLFGEDAYPDLDTKRLGWLAAVVFYGLNGVTLDAPDDAAFDLVIGIATGVVAYPAAGSILGSWH